MVFSFDKANFVTKIEVMSTKALKIPNELTVAPYYNRDLKAGELTIVESCTHTDQRQRTMLLQDHMLLVVLEGTNSVHFGNAEYVVGKNEMIILKKAIQVTFDKKGNPDNDHVYHGLMFFFKDEFLMEFMKMANISSAETEEIAKISVKPVKERLLRFFESVVPYFEEPDKIDGGLIKLKILELLYDIASTDKTILHQLLQLKKQVYGDIPSIVNKHYDTPITLNELAYLSGRSLSTFKRDFHSIYGRTPAQWIREKRLAKAKEMLKTDLPITEICYSLGFESVAHFSRLYKSYYGVSPSSDRVLSRT